MCCKIRSSFIASFVLALGVAAGALALGQPAKEKAQPDLPPGVSEDMQACALAGTPGKMHEFLKKSVGVWRGKTQMWMSPDPSAEPARGECTWTITSILDGRFIRADLAAELPGLGPYTGLGITGFDNVSQKFVGSWADTCSTGIMHGVGELSADGKVLNWNYTYNCPVRKKPAVVREVHTYTGENTMTFEMFTTDPRSGKEYRCMRVEFARGV